MDSHFHKPIFYPSNLMMAQMLSDLHGARIKWNTTYPRIFQNTTQMKIVLEVSTEDGQFQVLFILSLAFLNAGQYRSNHMWPLNPLMERLDACTNMSRRINLSGDTSYPYHSTILHQQNIDKTTQVVFMLLNVKQLLLELNTLILPSFFYKKNLTMVYFF